MAASAVERACGTAWRWTTTGAGSPVPRTSRWPTLEAVLRALDDVGVAAEDVALRRPTLDEVFLSYRVTGEAVAA